jgi:hypothetical protein
VGTPRIGLLLAAEAKYEKRLTEGKTDLAMKEPTEDHKDKFSGISGAETGGGTSGT